MADAQSNMSESRAIVLDCGTKVITAGFAGEEKPTAIIPSIVGRPKEEKKLAKDLFIGTEALAHRSQLQLICPMQRGVVKHWPYMDALLEHAVREGLQAKLEGSNVIMSDGASFSPFVDGKRHRESLVTQLFEKHHVNGFYLVPEGLGMLIGSGKTTSLVLQCGEGIAQALPVFECYLIFPAISTLPLAGRDLTLYLQKLLIDKGWVGETEGDLETVREIKEKLCYIEADCSAALAKSKTDSSFHRPYKLPDGNEVILGPERFQCPELLFQPALNEAGDTGLHKLVYDAIMKCDMNCRKAFYSNVLPTGGSTMCPGFADRLTMELTRLAPPAAHPKVITYTRLQPTIFEGLSVLASLTWMKEQWITAKKYQELGPSCIHKTFGSL